MGSSINYRKIWLEAYAKALGCDESEVSTKLTEMQIKSNELLRQVLERARQHNK